jgi:mannosyltransferase OCH1-like enzyme
MNTKIIITIGFCILVLVTSYFIYIKLDLDKYSEVYIENQIKSKREVNSIYKPPSSPKTPVVPMKLFQTWHSKDLPPKMQETVETLKKQNPELEYFLFDENECINFITTHFDEEVVDAYNKLIPAAYKADLWRYCVMYIHGGVYLDIKYQCVDGFKFIDIMDREHFVLDTDSGKSGIYGIYNALIISKPGNPIFLDCIKNIVRNTQTNYYGFNTSCPTGPVLLGKLYFGNIEDNMHMFDNMDLAFNRINGTDIVIYKNQIILQSYPEYRKEQRVTQKQKYYVLLWYDRAIYNK